MAIAAPFNLQKWIEDNRDLLKPPVGNACLYKEADDFIVMIVGGPNARPDYHYNETEELFYQLEGEITLKIIENDEFKDIKIGPGEMFLLPAGIPHSPQRPAGTVGLVIEKMREQGQKDGLLWFNQKTGEKVHEEYFQLDSPAEIGPKIKAAIERYKALELEH